MTPPSPLQWEVAGIPTRPHDDPKRAGYLVRVKSLNVWVPVEQVLRSELLPIPAPLPSGTPTTDANRRECDERLHRELNQPRQPNPQEDTL